MEQTNINKILMETEKKSDILELQARALVKMYEEGEVQRRVVRIRDYHTGRSHEKVILHSVINKTDI